MVIPVANWCAWNGPHWPGKESGRIGDQRKNQDHPDHSIVKISFEETWRPCCHSDFNEKPVKTGFLKWKSISRVKKIQQQSFTPYQKKSFRHAALTYENLAGTTAWMPRGLFWRKFLFHSLFISVLVNTILFCFFFLWHINLCWLFYTKTILVEEH